MSFSTLRLIIRNTNIVRSFAYNTTIRTSSSHDSHKDIDPMKGKMVSDKVTLPDSLGHSVGPERFELLNTLAGNDDVFEMKPQKRGKGTKDEPNIVPSMYEKRLMGCICDEDSAQINWMFLYKGEPKRCFCGHWFKLVDLDKSKYITID